MALTQMLGHLEDAAHAAKRGGLDHGDANGDASEGTLWAAGGGCDVVGVRDAFGCAIDGTAKGEGEEDGQICWKGRRRCP